MLIQGWRSGESARLPPMHVARVSIPGPGVICGLSLLLVLSLMCIGEQGWRSGESARFPPMHVALVSIPGPSVICGLSLLLFLSLLRGVFRGYSGFSLSLKINISKFQFDPEFEGHRFVNRKTVGCYPR